ncbi:acyltransferase [Microbacterium oxydans]|uniref:acyltransferase family protein n=1 Tax=Microbacterium sp. B19(2022) TaxID=2914045 RepID=UPI0014311220|nr:acyltransferase family protein [Microbacterium sp. B19(2022)]NJI60705.1 acyltransferase [Microbacterium sp. B19(2022)]
MELRKSLPGARGPLREKSSDFRPDIQGLRAVAVLAVVLYHAGLPFMPGGYVGVDVFFVISGFLITTHLLQGLATDGRVRFASFYARRARRILPASFVVLVATVLAALIWVPPLLMNEVWRGAVATALYVPNMLFAVEGTNYLAETTPSLFQHYWSLGIEEQFYLVWPLLLALGWRWLRSRRVLFVALVILVVLSFAAGLVLTFRNQPWAFFLLPTRAWELGIGGIVAFLLLRRPGLIPASLAGVLGWLGVALMVGPVFLFTSQTAFPGYWAAVPVVGTALVVLAGASRSRFAPTTMLSLSGMQFIGKISYSLYLVHWPVLLVPQIAAGYANPLPLWATLALAGICIPLAWLLFHYVEETGRSATWLVKARPRRSLLAALAGSVLCVAIAAGALLYSNSRPLYADRSAEAASISTEPKFTPFVPDDLVPALRAASGDQPDTYDDGCHLSFADIELEPCVYGDPADPRIVLFGDSHAAQWFPALEEFAVANGYSLENRTKSSCASISATMLRDGVPYVQCDEWRSAVIAHLNDEQPALVLLSNFGYNEISHAGGDESGAWGEALRRTLEAIEAPTAVIADTPNLGETPSVCLSAHLDDTAACALSQNRAMDSPTRAIEKEVAASDGAGYLDFTDYICGADVCGTIQGDTLVYRDAHHLTASFSRLLAPAADRLLADVIG